MEALILFFFKYFKTAWKADWSKPLNLLLFSKISDPLEKAAVHLKNK